jgi:hypothetical protein
MQELSNVSQAKVEKIHNNIFFMQKKMAEEVCI